MNNIEIMRRAVAQADYTMEKGMGGPFGAAIVKDGKVISVASNTVLSDSDPTAHAEINAIRQACKALGTHDLSGCEIYATSEPCPMCLSAIIWANIDVVYYGCTAEDAAAIGFRDDFIYDYIKTKEPEVLSLRQLGREDCIRLFESYVKNSGQLY